MRPSKVTVKSFKAPPAVMPIVRVPYRSVQSTSGQIHALERGLLEPGELQNRRLIAVAPVDQKHGGAPKRSSPLTRGTINGAECSRLIVRWPTHRDARADRFCWNIFCSPGVLSHR